MAIAPLALTLVGLVLMFVGLWWLFPPAALIALGALLVVEGYDAKRPPSRKRLR